MVHHKDTKASGNQLLASEWNAEHILTYGADADKPTTGLTVGQIYWATDTLKLYRAVSATAWECIHSRLTKASDTLRQSNDGLKQTNQGAYTKVKEIIVNDGFTGCRIKFDLRKDVFVEGEFAYAKIYKNGTAIGTERQRGGTEWGTFSEDFTGPFVNGDLIQIYAYTTDTNYAQVQNMRIYFDTAISRSMTNNDPPV